MRHLSLTLLLDHAAICVKAVSGVRAAKGKRVDLFVMLLLALATGVGAALVLTLRLAGIDWKISLPLFKSQ
jgi:uncharacterized membrane protein YeiH